MKKSFMKTFLCFGLLMVNAASLFGQLDLVKTKSTSTFNMDGKFLNEEWQTAHREKIDGVNIYFMADSQWLYIGIENPESATHFSDLYIKSGQTLNLHASMQLGERILPADNSWNDNEPPWTWGNNKDWKANVVSYKKDARDDQPFATQISHYQGQEFKIALSKLHTEFKLFIQIRDFVNENQKTYPVSGDRYNPDSWLTIKIMDR